MPAVSHGLKALVCLSALVLTGCDPQLESRSAKLSDTTCSHPQRPSADKDRDRLDALIATRELKPIPSPPPVRRALRDLGQLLNFDPILSGNRDTSCATCHHPSLATVDHRHLPDGTGGTGLGRARGGGGIVPRNSPALFNLHSYGSIFWDNRIEQSYGQIFTPAGKELTPALGRVFEFGMVSAQAMFPVTSHTEMRGEPGSNDIADAPNNTQVWKRLTHRVLAIPEYKDRLRLAYPGEHYFNFAHIANAIAAFEIDAFTKIDSPWQRYLKGNKRALSKTQVQGALAFFDAGCADCHSGPLFSDFKLHNTGLAPIGPGKGVGEGGLEDWGRMNVTGDTGDKHRFRTAPLVNVELTAPYGHAGQFPTLRSHIEHYIDPVESLMGYDCFDFIHAYEPWLWFFLHPTHEDIAQSIDPKVLALQEIQVDAIVEFLGALTDPKAGNLEHEVPRTVPSGLPVDRIGEF